MKPFDWLPSLLAYSKSRGDDATVEFSDRAKWEEMIRTPDWEMVAAVLGEAPPGLRALYSTDVVLQSYWEVETNRPEDTGAYEVAEFEALRPESRRNMWPELSNGCLVLAGDGLGNEFFLKAGTGPDWPVFFYDHEGGEITLIAETLDGFLAMLRPSPPDDTQE